MTGEGAIFTVHGVSAKVTITGTVDVSVARSFKDRLAAALEEALNKPIVVDCTDAESIDESAMRELARVNRRLRAGGHPGIIVRARPTATFGLAQFAELLERRS